MPFCIESVRSCFCQVDNRFTKLINDSTGQDTLAKFMSEAIFPIIVEGARASGASSNTMKNIHIAHNAVKTTRDVTALLNVFRGAIPAAVGKVKEIAKLIGGLRSGEAVVLREPRDEPRGGFERQIDTVTVNGIERGVVHTLGWRERPKYNEIAHDGPEKLLKIGEDVGTFGGAVSYAAGFAVFKTAANARKHFDLKFGAVGNALADAFPATMAINHGFGLIRHSCGLAYQFKAYKRAARDLTSNMTQVDKDFTKAVVDETIALSEKVAEAFNDVTIFIHSSATPWWLRIPLALFINGSALLRSVRKTA